MNILITGGMGFIGINAAMRFTEKNHKVFVFDNLSKVQGLKWFNLLMENSCAFLYGDLRNKKDVEGAFSCIYPQRYDAVLHLGAQTAVTTSLVNPFADFEINTLGTLHLLEAMRKYCPHPKLIFASTNKVYGALENRKVIEGKSRYTFADDIAGIDEDEPLDFYTGYGCSKGAADQYVRDYARIYSLPTTVVRQSCCYGTHQTGTEDQGWVAWFVKAFCENIPLTIYGDGKQVRDVLYISDLIDLYELILRSDLKGEIFNIGGGISNSISLLELIDMLEERFEKRPEITFSKERPGDQKIFISDNAKAEALGWTPKVSIEEGLDRLIRFMESEI